MPRTTKPFHNGEPVNPDKLFHVNGEPVALAEFVADNADLFDADDVANLEALPVGGRHTYGDLDTGVFTVERVA